MLDKAQRLRPNQSATLPNNFDLTSTDKNALLAFTNNEKELIHIRERIKDEEKKLSELESSSIDQQLKQEHGKVRYFVTNFFLFSSDILNLVF